MKAAFAFAGRWLAICFLVHCSSHVWGLDPQKRITQYTLDTWRSERGLPNNTILAIAQDRSGYLWLGTAEGLVRFDGVAFTSFSGKDHPAFRDHFIRSLYVDRRGTLWIGTLHGQLLSWEQGRFRRHSVLPTAAGAAPRIAEDGEGTLWVGTAQGLFYRPPGSGGPFKKHPAFAGIRILSLAADRSGRLLISTVNQGLYALEKGRWRPVLAPADRLGGDIYCFRQDRSGALWLGTTNGLFSFQDNRLRRHPLKPGISATITSMAEDHDGTLWVGSEGGLYRRHREAFQSLDADQGLGSKYVYAICEDREGSLWVGTVEGGLTQVREEKITAFTGREGLRGEVFRSLHEDESGAMWIGGYGGYLSRYLNGRWENFNLPARFRSETILSLEADAGNSLWLGTSSGLLRYQDGQVREIPLPGPAANGKVQCVLKDRSGRLWIGTFDAGLWCRQQGGFRRISRADGLRSDRITCLLQDRRGCLWVGSESGLNALAAGGEGTITDVPPLHDSFVVSLHEDGRGTLWIATANQGLKVLRHGSVGAVSVEQGLFDNRVYSIVEDGGDGLWLSSERGIFRVGKRELEDVAWGRKKSVAGRLFTEADGMRSRICSSGHPNGWKSADGRLWFATLKGAAVIDPARMRPAERVPPVLVEEVNVDNRPLPPAGASAAPPLQLAAGSKRFAFKYTAVSFIRASKIAFKYKLEGYDREWTEAGGRREAFYNDLRPGRYRFRVIAANADGVWNTAGASFAFRLRPFVYQTWWFMALAALAFAVLSGLSWQLLRKYLRAVTFWKKRTHIGHFRILETIGAGGMATVYRAQDLLAKKRIVALKVLKEESFHDEAHKQRFRHEARITEGLEHPHIVRVLERGEADGDWYIAMELLPGQTLSRLLRGGGRLAVSAALDVMIQVVDALGAIHAREIVHRDLKPENIMIDEQPGCRRHVTLLDFGLAITPAQSRLTMSGVVMGTIRYLPPERIEDGVSSPAGDIYSSGVIFYEMLTGCKPFWSEATGEVIHRILETYPVPAREIVPAVPLELDALIAAMIDKDPARRPSLAALAGELQRLAAKFSASPEAPER